MTPTSINKPWIDEQGNPITIEDCHEAIMLARSLIIKETEQNKVIKDSPQLKKAYERRHYILNTIADKFFMVQMKMKKVTKTTVRRRR